MLLALAAVPMSLGTGATDAVGADETANPHGSRDGCLACHEPDRPSLVGKALPVVKTCRGCHPTADMHPVDIVPKRVSIAAGFPLDEGGRMTCATCHDEPGHGAAEAALPGPWFRGGPYGSTTEFCHTCHKAEDLNRVDPHHPRFEDDPLDPSCSACHMTKPEDGATPEESKLRLPHLSHGPAAPWSSRAHRPTRRPPLGPAPRRRSHDLLHLPQRARWRGRRAPARQAPRRHARRVPGR